ncbi:predicted protein [Naegleria gruberi]|uniref:Predicted protein n=1 Tax=Naegleria gruberi TaxID=5762 RepID=D2V9C3_NAEGR|nr:uncharacterized protein NAEGRDRAFT_65390 [Naegleria gruberi]EFC46433.1 predicted protein [Naegleria gruberi]|eukprot:XP_002679177.1 predicted protein [Naegleria gruberi strain NEG-M]
MMKSVLNKLKGPTSELIHNKTFQNSNIMITRTFKCNLIQLKVDNQGKENNYFIASSQLRIYPDNFSYPLDDNGNYAILQFSKDSESGVYEFYHVEVPVAFKGKGIAMPFAKACFDHALENNWKVKVTCTYLKWKFLEKYYDTYERILVD